MSLSNQRQSEWGTIFMGPGASMETTLERVEAGGPSLAWTTDTEAEYLARVREKATAKAKEIMLAAQAEGARLREDAFAQGYEAGLAQAQGELEEFRQGMGASVAAVLSAIEESSGSITAAWREELVGLVRQCVETAVNHELSGQRAALLAGLFDAAVAKMEVARRITILVSPEDEPAVADMVDAASQTGDQVFSVRADTSLAPGSLILESEDSRVDNSLTVRRAMVENILAQLDLPTDTPADMPADTPADMPADTPTDMPADTPTSMPANISTQAAADLRGVAAGRVEIETGIESAAPTMPEMPETAQLQVSEMAQDPEVPLASEVEEVPEVALDMTDLPEMAPAQNIEDFNPEAIEAMAENPAAPEAAWAEAVAPEAAAETDVAAEIMENAAPEKPAEPLPAPAPALLPAPAQAEAGPTPEAEAAAPDAMLADPPQTEAAKPAPEADPFELAQALSGQTQS